jgi:hypothetical protein
MLELLLAGYNLYKCQSGPNEQMDMIVTHGLLELEEALKNWKTPSGYQALNNLKFALSHQHCNC